MILSLGYVAKSGKDTVANYLVSVHGFRRLAFADSLKEACKHIYGFSDEQVYGNLKETIDPYWGVTPRFVLQKVGTECLRNVYDRDIWIKSAQRKILNNPNDNWVITDMRFLNEAKAVKEWGGRLVRIDRPTSGAVGGIAGHESEMSLAHYEEWDYVIYNNVQVHAVLYDKVEEMMKYFNKLLDTSSSL